MGQQELDDRELGYIDLFALPSSFLLRSSFFALLSRRHLVPSWLPLVPSWLSLVPSWAPSWAILAPSWLNLAPSWVILAPSWAILPPQSFPKASPDYPKASPDYPNLPPSSPEAPQRPPEQKKHKSAKNSWNTNRYFDTLIENNWPKLFLEEFSTSIPFSGVLHKNAQKNMKKLPIIHCFFTTFSLRILSVICQKGWSVHRRFARETVDFLSRPFRPSRCGNRPSGHRFQPLCFTPPHSLHAHTRVTY